MEKSVTAPLPAASLDRCLASAVEAHEGGLRLLHRFLGGDGEAFDNDEAHDQANEALHAILDALEDVKIGRTLRERLAPGDSHEDNPQGGYPPSLSDTECPSCGSEDIEGGSWDCEAGHVSQRLGCSACEAEWTNVYKLIATTVLEPPISDEERANGPRRDL